jgi:hypothetical protein
MKKSSLNRKGFKLRAVFLTLAVVLVQMTATTGHSGQSVAYAQNFGQRLITGRVLLDGKGEDVVVGATVFLKNLKTKAIRSYTTDDKGHYRFGMVKMNEDQELWAEKDGKKSAVKTISTWDSRKELDAELRLK